MTGYDHTDLLKNKELEVPEEDRDLLSDFWSWMKAEGIKESTRSTYQVGLRRIYERIDGSIKDVDKKDMIRIIGELRDEFAESSVNMTISRVKKFYKWLNGGEKYPENVDWLKQNRGANNTLPDELLTKDEIRQMIDSCDNPQDRAMIATLYESGLRLQEFVSLNVGSVEFEEKMARIILPRNGEGQKTGQRRIPLINSVPHLQEWINQHPKGKNGDPLWISMSPNNLHNRIHKNSMARKVRRIARCAGIEKNVHPHLFRHSRATEIAKMGVFSEAEMRIMFGWAKGSQMPSKYIHLAGADVDDKFKKAHGIIEEEEEEVEEPLKPVDCPRCDYRNPTGAKFCSKCGLALTFETAREFDKTRGKADTILGELITEEDADAIVAAAKKIIEQRSKK